MHEQIWIAPDGGREVRVGFVSQSKVPQIFRAIHGLPQGTQQNRLQQLVVGPAPDLLQQLGVVLGLRGDPTPELQSELAQEFAQIG